MNWDWLWWVALIWVTSVLWRQRGQIREQWSKRTAKGKALAEVHALMRERGIEPRPKGPPLPGPWRSKIKSYTCPKCNDYSAGGVGVSAWKCPKCNVKLRLDRCDHPIVYQVREGQFQCRACWKLVEPA